MSETAEQSGAEKARSSEPASVDPLIVRGHPIHTRSHVVDVRQADPEHLLAHAEILDLRKCGFVPAGDDLQAAGFIHHMRLDVRVHRESRVIESLEPSQPVVAFEAGPFTGGESCRDPVPLMQRFVGERLDDGFASRLNRGFGGPLGCTHLLTLMQLVASTLIRSFELEAGLAAPGRATREPGERVLVRSIALDGFQLEESGGMEVALQLNDVHTAPLRAVEQLLDRFDRQHEVRALLRVEMENLTLSEIGVAERERTRPTLATAPWRSRSAQLESLVGHPALRGLARKLLQRFGDDAASRPLLDTLLTFAPGLIQCLAALASRIVEQIAERGIDAVEPGGLASGGFPDSCYIWRSGGHLSQWRHGRR